MPDEPTPSRIANGPQILCRMCGAVCNHMTGLCPEHRRDGLTAADRAYLE
jgi:RNA polymerase subunit RPABC4/transcription elongation factor Spt4